MKNTPFFTLGVLVLTIALYTACKEPEPEHSHTWGNWQTTTATETTNGVDKITCTVCGAIKETKFSGEYATGSAGLEFTLITTGTYIDTYRVSKGTFDGAVVHIPAYHRPTAEDDYKPITSIRLRNDDYSPNTTLITVTFADENQLRSFPNEGFYSCTSLASITIPKGVTNISGGTFSGCTSLTKINIPASVTSIGTNPFYGCTSLTSIMIDENNPNYAGDGVILYNKTKTTLIYSIATGSVAILEGVTNIGVYAFNGCTSLTSITIPSTVTTIGYNAFQDCTSLTSITIPASVTTIDAWVFSGWTASQTINVPFATATAIPAEWSTYWNKEIDDRSNPIEITAVIKYLQSDGTYQ